MKSTSSTIIFLIGLLFVFEQGYARPEGDEREEDYNNDDVNDDPEDYPSTDPKILSTPQHVEPKLGSTVKLNCMVERAEEGILQWNKIINEKEQPLFMNGFRQNAPDRYKVDTKDNTLTIEKIQIDDNGEFVCNIVGESARVIHTISIKTGPVIRIRPEAGVYAENEGRPITFVCEASGSPEPKIHWERKNQVKNETDIYHGKSFSYDTVNWRHSGIYTCFARNAQGETTETVQFKVRAKPEVRAEAKYVNSAEKYESEIVCNVIYCGNLSCHVEWKKDGDRTIKPDQKHYHIFTEGHKHMLRISATKNSDMGQYSCVVVNEFGIAREDIILQGKPLKPVFVSQTTSRSGPVLTWKTQSKSKIIEYEVIYKKQQDDSWLIKHPEVTEGTNGIYTLSYTFEIPQDQPGTYTAKLRAKTAEYGSSDISDEVIFPGGGFDELNRPDSERLEPSQEGTGSASHLELRISAALIMSLLTAYYLH